MERTSSSSNRAYDGRKMYIVTFEFVDYTMCVRGSC